MDTIGRVLNFIVDEDGFTYQLTTRKGEIIKPQFWNSMIKNFSPNCQSSVLLLSQLVNDGKAKIIDDFVLLPHITVANLLASERELLGLPEPFPYDVQIKAIGNLGNPSFRYAYYFLDAHGKPFVNPKRIGTYLKITDNRSYLLTKQLYYLLEAIDTFNNVPPDQRSLKSNFLNFTKIKGLAKDTAAILDSYLNSEEVIAPSKITLRLKRVNEDIIEIEPLFCEEKTDPEKGNYLKPILTPEHHTEFLNKFDNKEVSEIYAIQRGPKIVLSDEQKEVLDQIKRHRKVSGMEKDLLLKYPSQFFNLDVLDIETPYLESGKLVTWSDRVIAIGEYKPKLFPFIQPAKEPWIPPVFGIVIDGKTIYLSVEEIQQLKARVEKAMKIGEKEIVWDDIKISEKSFGDVYESLNELLEISPSKETTTGEALKNIAERKETNKPTNILLIKDNIEEAYHKVMQSIRVRDAEITDKPKYLRKDTELLPHQIEGFQWLQELWLKGEKGALLADDMGLGKTLQTLSFLAWVQELMDKNLYPQKPILIVTPVSLMDTWEEEYSKFLEPIWGKFIKLHGESLAEFKNFELIESFKLDREIKMDKELIGSILVSGKGMFLNLSKLPPKSVSLTSYETLRNYQFSFGQVDWAVLVLDEAQKIKNPVSLITMAAKAMKYDFGIALTGTPVENSWIDLWSIMDYVHPAKLGSLRDFRQKYYAPLKNPDVDIISLGKDLREKLKPLFKRRLKDEIGIKLPPKKVCLYKTEMPQIQLNHYLEAIKSTLSSLPDPLTKKRRNRVLTAISALRDISLHPFLPYYNDNKLLQADPDEIINSSAKLKKTFEILDSIKKRNEKVVIFLINKKMQRILIKLIKEKFDLDQVYVINGETPPQKRLYFVKEFEKKAGFNVIIISPLAAGVGLNITAANHVIHLSRHWNPAREDQATDRVYRIGQSRSVFVHIPLAVHPKLQNDIFKGSFDQKLHNLLNKKRELSKRVLFPPTITDTELQQLGEEILNAQVETDVLERKHSLTIEDLDSIDPEYFEKVIAALYRKKGYYSEVTPYQHDYGADVVVLDPESKEGYYLIQCKHTINYERPMPEYGVEEILDAKNKYEKMYKTKFRKLAVVTNAREFLPKAVKMAKEHNVSLIKRKELSELLKSTNLTFGDVY